MKATKLYNKLSQQTERVKLLDQKIQMVSMKGNWSSLENELPHLIQEHIQLLEEQQSYLKERAHEKLWHRFFHWVFGEPVSPHIPELKS